MKLKSGQGFAARVRSRRARRKSERAERLSKRRVSQHGPGRTGNREWLGPG
jgi:hypothetical protein